MILEVVLCVFLLWWLHIEMTPVPKNFPPGRFYLHVIDLLLFFLEARNQCYLFFAIKDKILFVPKKRSLFLNSFLA